MNRGFAVVTPGLKKRLGSYMVAYGVFNPVLLIDPTTPTHPGYNALVAHELYHVQKRHKLKEFLVILLCFPLWPWYKRAIETRADRYAYKMWGDQAFRAFLMLHRPPSSRWGRWKYGATHDARYARCVRKGAES